MNRNRITALLILAGAGIVVLGGLGEAARTRQAEEAKRKQIREDVVLNVTAIKRAESILLDQLEEGKIRDFDTLVERMNDEIAFQQIAIREDRQA